MNVFNVFTYILVYGIISPSILLGCRNCGKKPVSVYYFSENDTAKIILDIKNPKDLGDVYADFYLRYGDTDSSKKVHLFFYYNEEKKWFSEDPGFDLEKNQKFVEQGYLFKLHKIVGDGYKTGNVDFVHEGLNFFFFKSGANERVFYKLNRKADGDIIFSDDDFDLYKDYKKIVVNLNNFAFAFNASYVHDIYFKGVNKILTVEVNRATIAHTRFFTVSVKIYWDGVLLKEKKIKNGEECTFSIEL